MSHRMLCSALALAAALAALVVQHTAWAQAVPAALTQDPPAEEPPPKFDGAFLASDANIKAGETVWQNQCRHCHGNSAYPGKAPKLRPGTYTPDFIYDRVTYGFRGMPPWKAVFSLDERMSVVAFIKSERFSP